MKFLSVFVLFIYMRTACSNGTGSRSLYTYPDSQASYNPPAALQQKYTMGPGLPIPNYTAETAPGIQNNVQTNYAGYAPYFSAIRHIEKNLNDIYKKSVPKKLYTIVHPNGTIEYTDEIHSVKARYSNYHMVKATDILARINRTNVYNGAPQNTLPNPLNNPTTITNQNADPTTQQAVVNSIDLTSNPIDLSSNPEPQNTAPNPLNNPSTTTNQNTDPITQQAVAKSTDVTINPYDISSNPAATQSKELDIKQTIEDVNKSSINGSSTDILPKEDNFNLPITQDPHSNAVAANPLPIHTTRPIPDVIINDVQPSESKATNETTTVNNSTQTQVAGDAVAVPDSNSTDVITTTTVPVQSPPNETVEVILPGIRPQNITQETHVPTTIEESGQSQVIPEVTTIEEPITPGIDDITNVKNNTSPSPELATVSAPNSVVDVSQPKDIPESNPIPTSISNQTSTQFGNDSLFTWFYLSQDSVWQALRNNTNNNIYFLFLPRKPKHYKETRITTFPNGTILEQIIERDEDDVQNGQPEVNSTIVSS